MALDVMQMNKQVEKLEKSLLVCPFEGIDCAEPDCQNEEEH